MSLIILTIILLLCFYYNDSFIRECFYGWTYYNERYTLIARLLTCCVSIVAMSAVVGLMPDFKEKSSMGRNTLFIYLYHNNLTTPCSRLLTKYDLPDNILVFFVLTIIIYFIVDQLSKIRFLNSLTIPLDSFLELKHKYSKA